VVIVSSPLEWWPGSFRTIIGIAQFEENSPQITVLEDNVVFETGIPLDSLSQRGTRTHRIGRVTSHGEGGN